MLASLDAPFAPEPVPEDSQPVEAADNALGEYDLRLDELGLHSVTVETPVPRTGLTRQAVSSMLLMLKRKGEVEAHVGSHHALRRGE